MAHKEQIDFCEKVRELYPDYFKDTFVLDVGSLDINGNNQYLFERVKYIGVDIGEGKNVDIVQKAHELQFPEFTFDTIISTEMLEHDMYYEQSIKNMYRMLKSGGLFLFSCATEGRPEHGTRRSEPESAPLLQSDESWQDYYKNLVEDDIKITFGNDIEKYFYKYQFLVNKESHDLYFWGIKNGIYTKRNNLSHNIKNNHKELFNLLKFDEIYYLKQYLDIDKSIINPYEHFLNHGILEGRLPNKLAEDNSIFLNEIPFIKKILEYISELKNKLNIQKEENSNLNSTIQELSTQKDNLENEYNQKTQDIENLNKNMDEILNDLEIVKETKQLVIEEIEVEKEKNAKLVEENSNLNSTIQELSTQKDNLENEYNQKTQDIENLNKNMDEILNDLEIVKETKQLVIEEIEVEKEKNAKLVEENSNLNSTIQELSTQKDNLENEYNQKTQDIENLNKNMDEILNDLEIVKETKQLVIQEIEVEKEKNTKLVEENSSLTINIEELLSDIIHIKEMKK
ncbi:hypothetical protein LPB137_11885 [Poseidonibacter parvus]|uniref:Methyltransferase type 11 domain-containing protein n=1 Tax=Poseidonibacter parvus TaxID=1850254 RepID=A0A1P8KPN2_9BACT|nr:methyltransferase domain-containing protein [Poseidonibacter parvus]APW66496.1 hypothetical protein LPB137_11885 [Poseidonibacter parvus]